MIARTLRLALAAFAALGLASTHAIAAEIGDGSYAPSTAPPPDVAPRPWLYLDDPTLASPLRAIAFSRATYTHVDSPSRPFGANLGRAGAVVEAGAEVGLASWVSIAASGFAGGGGAGESSNVGALAGLRFAPFAKEWTTTHLVLSGGYLRELTGGNGAWGRVALAQDFRRLRVGGTLHGEHVFQGGRDAVDVLVMAGATYEVAGPLRLGVEYVAQDLEGALDHDEAEQGVRHFVGPTAAFELLDRRLSITGGPAFGLTAQTPSVSGRIGIAYAY